MLLMLFCYACSSELCAESGPLSVRLKLNKAITCCRPPTIVPVPGQQPSHQAVARWKRLALVLGPQHKSCDLSTWGRTSTYTSNPP
jgi:hypothetical protein